MTNTSTICILMATYNGQAFLAEQLLSIENQTHKNWHLILSDDGSNDDTLTIAKQFQQKWGADRLEIRHGPQQGFCQNFLAMACDPSIKADFYAFSDQDDVWMTDKLSKAIAYFHAENNPETLGLYCGRTQLVDEELNIIGASPSFTEPRSFRNAIVQSIAGGNTMVFNQSTKNLLEKLGLQQVPSHDWWLYQIIEGAGGIVYFDPVPSIFYRQHHNALVGANSSLKEKLRRIRFILNGGFRKWNSLNYDALHGVSHLLTKDNQAILDVFGKLRNANLKDRIRLLWVSGLYRQTWQGRLTLWLAMLLNKL